MSVRGLANSCTKQYCITYSGQVQGRTFTRSITIREKFPPTQFRAFTAARNDFQQFARRMGSIVNVDVTNIAFGACAGSGGGGGGGGGGGTTPISPDQVTTLGLWLKADAGVYSDAGVTPATNGGTVQQWNDQSGAGEHVSQATAGNRPTYLTGQQNGLPAISFPAIVMPAPPKNLSRVTFASSQPYSFMVVVRFNSTSGGDLIGNDSSSFNSMPIPGFGRNYNAAAPVEDGLSHFYAGIGSYPSGPAISGDVFHILTVVFNGASSFIRVDGNQSGALDAGAGAFTGLRIGSSGYLSSGNGSYFRGYVAEVGKWGKVLSDGEIAGLEQYMRNKWGL